MEKFWKLTKLLNKKVNQSDKKHKLVKKMHIQSIRRDPASF